MNSIQKYNVVRKPGSSLSLKLEASSILHTLELRQTRRTLSDLCQLDALTLSDLCQLDALTLSDLCQLDALTAQGIGKLTLDVHEGP